MIALKIGSLKIRKAKIAGGRRPLVVLLVTTAHFRLLDDDSTFVPSILSLAVEPTRPWQEVDLLAAVIDRIPQRSTIHSRLPGSLPAHVDSLSKMEDGFQGVSVAVLDSKAAAPDLWSPRKPSNEREEMPTQQECTLSFSFPPSPGVRSELSGESVFQPLVKRVLQLPVANTLFQNGKMSTIFTQRWTSNTSNESSPEYVSGKKIWLRQQTVQMGSVFADEGMRLQLDHLVRSHLVPITPARTITAAVGNIVRKISGGDASAEAAPASEELERAISTAIKQGQIPAQQVGVWALIRPQNYATLDEAAQSQDAIRDMIQYAILSGCRLHKVLSGGGGWGEKQGLLALDPDSDYSHLGKAIEPSFGDDPEFEAERNKALGEIARPGDSITFYVYKSSLDPNPANPQQPVLWNSSQTAAATLIFGSLPSTMDAMPEVGNTENTVHSCSELTVEENHFGMLSEQGMSLESSFINTNIIAKEMQYLKPDLYRQAYEVRRSDTVTTKLDAPYTMLSIKGQASRVSISSEIKRKEFQAYDVHLQDLMPQEPSMPTGATKYTAAQGQSSPKVDDQTQEAQITNSSTQERQRCHTVIVPAEAKNAPSFNIRRHLYVTKGNYYREQDASPEQKLHVELEPMSESKSFTGRFQEENKPLQKVSHDSSLIIKGRAEGGNTGTECKGKEGNVFMIRKHITLDPSQKSHALQKGKGTISRDEAMVELNGYYHLKKFDNKPENEHPS